MARTANKKEQENKESKTKSKAEQTRAELLSAFADVLGAKELKEILQDDPKNIKIERFPTGSLLLDRDLKGGWAKGTMIELMGENQSGKTTVCIHAVAEYMKAYPDDPVLWLDLEKVFDPDYFESIGVDVTNPLFLLLRPTVGEEVWSTIHAFANKGKGRGLVVVDSVTLLLSTAEDENDMDKASVGASAKMNNKGIRKLFPYLKDNNITLFVINQFRSNIGVMYGSPNVTTGGRSWEYFARTRVQISSSKGELGEYSNVKLKLVKANFGHRDRVTETTIDYGKGFNKIKELITLAVEQQVIEKAGAWFRYNDTNIGQGFDNTYETLLDNPELFEEIKSKLSFD